jgi:hypothetical protein
MEPISSFKIQLESALLCLDLACNAVFDGSLSGHCPACGAKIRIPSACGSTAPRASRGPGGWP